MPATLRITRSFNHFEPIGESMMGRLDQAVRDAAQEAKIRAQMDAPVDTGALRESLHIITDDYSGYAEAVQAVQGRQAGVALSNGTGLIVAGGGNALSTNTKDTRNYSNAVILPEEVPTKPHFALVASCVEHAIYNEYGTHRMPPRPYLTPAVEATAPHFFKDIEDILAGRDLEGDYGDTATAPILGAEAGGMEAIALPAIEAAAPVLLLPAGI